MTEMIWEPTSNRSVMFNAVVDDRRPKNYKID